MSLPKKCLVDTNVPIKANLDTATISDELGVSCIKSCVDAIEHVMKRGKLVIDCGDEIYSEYLKNLCLSEQKRPGDVFMKWVNDHRHNPKYCDRVLITKNDDSYDEFPTHDDLNDFDSSDRKFVAVANAHADKPPILQATDSKWWGWKDALAEVEITIQFLCPEYVKAKYAEKMGT